MTRPVFRFAPSPNGLLHLGHAYSALLNDAMARKAGGRLLLRIEDIDPGRSRPEFDRAIRDDLAWLGLRWEEPVRRQSRHLDDHGAAFERLRAAGLVYPCRCSRADVLRAATEAAARDGTALRRDPDGAPLYPGTCRGAVGDASAARDADGRQPSWRLHTERALAAVAPDPLRWTRIDRCSGESAVEARPSAWGDPVIRRRDVPSSYHLAVVVDDGLQGVTHVVRGRDLEAATDLHRLLQALLGLASPRYHHHALVLEAAGGPKLSKSAGSTSLRVLREAGDGPGDVRRRLGFP